MSDLTNNVLLPLLYAMAAYWTAGFRVSGTAVIFEICVCLLLDLLDGSKYGIILKYCDTQSKNCISPSSPDHTVLYHFGRIFSSIIQEYEPRRTMGNVSVVCSVWLFRSDVSVWFASSM
jgi:hypothetical protein